MSESKNIYRAEIPKQIVAKESQPLFQVNEDKYLIQFAIPVSAHLPAVYDLVVKESKENSNTLEIVLNRKA